MVEHCFGWAEVVPSSTCLDPAASNCHLGAIVVKRLDILASAVTIQLGGAHTNDFYYQCFEIPGYATRVWSRAQALFF